MLLSRCRAEGAPRWLRVFIARARRNGNWHTCSLSVRTDAVNSRAIYITTLMHNAATDTRSDIAETWNSRALQVKHPALPSLRGPVASPPSPLSPDARATDVATVVFQAADWAADWAATSAFAFAEDAKNVFVRTSFQLGLVSDPREAGWLALAFVGTLGLCLFAWRRATVRSRQQRRVRANDLAVRTADGAPVDDHDEHELEVRNELRAAAPGDSETDEKFEEATLSPRTYSGRRR